MGGSVTAASEKWALKCVSGLGGNGKQLESVRREGGRVESQVPWVGSVWRGREEERKGRRGFSPRVGLKTTTTTTNDGNSRVTKLRRCVVARKCVQSFSQHSCRVSTTPSKNPRSEKEEIRGESFAFLLFSFFFFQAVHLLLLLLPFSPSPLEMQCARGVGTTWPASPPPFFSPPPSSSCGQLRSPPPPPLSMDSSFFPRKGVYEGNN